MRVSLGVSTEVADTSREAMIKYAYRRVQSQVSVQGYEV